MEESHSSTYLNLLLSILAWLHHLHLLTLHELLLLVILHDWLSIHINHVGVHASCLHLLLLLHHLLLLHLGSGVLIEHLLLTAIFGHVLVFHLAVGAWRRLWRGGLLHWGRLGCRDLLLLGFCCRLLCWLIFSSRLLLLLLTLSWLLLFWLVAHILNEASVVMNQI
jgi:hypothetical protein